MTRLEPVSATLDGNASGSSAAHWPSELEQLVPLMTRTVQPYVYAAAEEAAAVEEAAMTERMRRGLLAEVRLGTAASRTAGWLT